MIIERSNTANINVLWDEIISKGIKNCFTDSEEKLYHRGHKHHSLAVRYMAKRLIMDMIKGIRHMTDLSIENDQYGKPVLNISRNGDIGLNTSGDIQRIFLSLSHSKKFVRALVIIKYKPDICF